MAGACSLQKPLAAPLLVVVELPDGELSETGKGTLAKGGMLSQLLGGKWSVASFAPPDPKVFDGFTPYGVPDLTVIDAPPAVADSMPAQGKLIAQAARNTGAKVIMLPHNDLGSSLAPLLACELNAAIYTEVIGFDVTESVICRYFALEDFSVGVYPQEQIWHGLKDRPHLGVGLV